MFFSKRILNLSVIIFSTTSACLKRFNPSHRFAIMSLKSSISSSASQHQGSNPNLSTEDGNKKSRLPRRKPPRVPKNPISAAITTEVDDNEMVLATERTSASAMSTSPIITNPKIAAKDKEHAESNVKATNSSNASMEFNSLDISVNTKKAIAEIMEYANMTPVQTASIPIILKGSDVVVKAKTGTGKTVAFLVPAIDILIHEKSRHQKNMRQLVRETSSGSVRSPVILVLSPTRELALQIADEAKTLCTFHGFGVVTLVGGTNAESDKRAVAKPGQDIFVGTPGRLLMLLQEQRSFAEQCAQTKVLVFDEADRLLDMGFKRDIDKIMAFLRPQQVAGVPPMVRQTLLFSATFSEEVREVAAQTLRPGYKVVDTVGEEEEQTHAHVPQKLIVTPIEDQIPALASLIAQQMTSPDHKVIVFFPTARHTGYLAELFNAAGATVLEIHSRKSQGARTRASEEFRSATSAVLFSSDVTARGMDYPDVTLVIQVGLTSRDQYIHRLGRTARAGKGGSGVLLCFPDEALVLRKELSDMPLQQCEVTEFNSSPMEEGGKPLLDLPARIHAVLRTTAREGELRESANQAWAAWLGFYNGYQKKLQWTPRELVEVSAAFARTLGVDQIPPLPKKTLGKMGLLGVEGLAVEKGGDQTSSRGQTQGRGRGPAQGRGETGNAGGRGGQGRDQEPRQARPSSQQPQLSQDEQPRKRTVIGTGASVRAVSSQEPQPRQQPQGQSQGRVSQGQTSGSKVGSASTGGAAGGRGGGPKRDGPARSPRPSTAS